MSEAARRSLAELQDSVLFAPDFPVRITYTRRQFVELSKARSAEMDAPGIAAIDCAGNQVEHLRNLVDLLGR